MFCTNCGKRIPDDSVFCTNCGHRVEQLDEPASEPEAAEAASEEPEAAPEGEAEPAAEEPQAPSEDAPGADGEPSGEAAAAPAEAAADAEPDASAEPDSEPDPIDMIGTAALDQPAAGAPTEEPEGAVCPACGAAVPAGFNFCTECGHDMRVPASPEPAADGSFTCPHCGGQHPAGTRFCTETGAPIDAPAAPADGRTQAFVQPAAAPAKKKGGAGKTVAIVVAAVVVLAALVIGGFVVYSNFFVLRAGEEETAGVEVEAEPDGSVEIDDEIFPDPVVRAYMEDNVDADGDGRLSEEECEDVTSISLEGVSTVENLGLFPNLESFSVDAGSQLAEPIDFSGNASLSSLSLPDNAVTQGLDATQVSERWLAVECRTYDNGDTDYSYTATRDSAGNALEADHGGAGNPHINSVYSYDADGNMVKRVSTSSGTSTTYRYEYDAAGNMVRASWSGNENTYSYDADGNLTGVTQRVDGETYSATFQYDDQGRCVRKDYGDGRVETWAYDDQGRCTSYRWPDGGAVDVTYEDGRIVAQSGGKTIEYDLGDDGRIVGASSSRATATCSYDDHGNLVEADVTYNGGHTYTYSIEYMRVFCSADTPQQDVMVSIEPSFSEGLFAAFDQSLPSVDINGQGLTFNRVPYFSAFL